MANVRPTLTEWNELPPIAQEATVLTNQWIMELRQEREVKLMEAMGGGIKR